MFPDSLEPFEQSLTQIMISALVRGVVVRRAMGTGTTGASVFIKL